MKAPVSSGGSRKVAPAGTHLARCYSIIDTGTHFDEKWQKRTRKVQFLFELPHELEVFQEEKGAQPFYVKSSFTLSMHEKAGLRKFVQSWLGKSMNDKEAADFDILTLCGQPCMVNIVHTEGENVYANIASIAPLMKGMVCPPQINETVTFDTTAPNKAMYDKLPDFIKEQINTSDEIIAMKSGVPQPKAQPQAAPSFQQERTAHASVVDGPATDFDQPAPDDLFATPSNDNPFK